VCVHLYVCVCEREGVGVRDCVCLCVCVCVEIRDCCKRARSLLNTQHIYRSSSLSLSIPRPTLLLSMYITRVRSHARALSISCFALSRAYFPLFSLCLTLFCTLHFSFSFTHAISFTRIHIQTHTHAHTHAQWITLADMCYCAAMMHPGGGRNDVPHRLKRQFCLFNVTMPSLAAVDNIFGSIIRGRLSDHAGVPKVVQEVA